MWFRRSLRLILALALLLAPLGMLGQHAAMAVPHDAQVMAGSGHCADMAAPQEQDSGDEVPANDIDCTIACSCMPPMGAQLGEPPLPSSRPVSVALDSLVRGLGPHAEPRPPQSS